MDEEISKVASELLEVFFEPGAPHFAPCFGDGTGGSCRPECRRCVMKSKLEKLVRAPIAPGFSREKTEDEIAKASRHIAGSRSREIRLRLEELEAKEVGPLVEDFGESEKIELIALAREALGEDVPQLHVPKIVMLAFDPMDVKDDPGDGPPIREIWADPIARTLWLAYKWRHLTDQHFRSRCLEAARYLKKRPPKRWEDVAAAVGRFGGITLGPGQEFCQELLPHLKGQAQIGYQVDWEAIERRKAKERLF